MTRRMAVMLAAAACLAVGAGACRSAANSASARREQATWRAQVAASKARARQHEPPPKESPFGNMALPTYDQMPKAKGHAYKYKQMAGAAVIVLIMGLVTFWVTKRYPSRRE